ncbi:MAG: fumarate hydratase [Candidatus Heimdallarchaeota archaeon]
MRLENFIEKTAVELLRIAVTDLPQSVYNALNEWYEKETQPSAISQLEALIKNSDIARDTKLPICQDTGVVAFFIEVGEGFPVRARLRDILIKATERATTEIPIRPNTVDWFKGNTRTNVGYQGHIPWLYWSVVPGDALTLTAMPKGGGSSNVANLGMLRPGEGIDGVKRFIIDSVARAGARGCPPYIVGVGIGGGEDMCMTLAKKALLRGVGVRNENAEIAKIEQQLLSAINALGIGTMGLGVGPTALDVNIELMARHPASLPVGVVLSCWAERYAKAKISKDGQVTYISHNR